MPFNVDILSRNGRISEVCHLPDDITIKALNGSLTTYKLFDVTYGNGNHFKSGMCLPSPRVPQAGLRFRTIDLKLHWIAQFEENRIIRKKMLNSSKINNEL